MTSTIPAPYYQDDWVEIYHADCMDILPLLPDKSVDLILTDPPYGINVDYGNEYKDTEDNLRFLVSTTMPEILRVAKVALITPGNKNLFLYPSPTWVLSWTIPSGVGISRWGFVCWHAILAYGKDPYLARRLGSRPDAVVFTANRRKNKKHPVEKPLDVWEWLLIRGSPSEDDVLLDPFMGSGTTLVAAKKHSRRAIGIEISEEYCKIAIERLKNETV